LVEHGLEIIVGNIFIGTITVVEITVELQFEVLCLLEHIVGGGDLSLGVFHRERLGFE
jgi:hypothetical protein